LTTSQRAHESNIRLSFGAIFRCEYVSTRHSSSSLLRNEAVRSSDASWNHSQGDSDIVRTFSSRNSRRHTEFTDIIASSAFFQALRGQREAKRRCKKNVQI